MTELRDEVHGALLAAKQAAVVLRQLDRGQKDAAIAAISAALIANLDQIIRANAEDVARAEAGAADPAMVDRLRLDENRLRAIAAAAQEVGRLPDPIGDVVRGYTLPNGLEIRQIRVPLGVVAMIYEARPNVTVDAAVLCLKTGNAAVLRGSGSALATNRALVEVMRAAVQTVGLPADSIGLVPGDSHESVELLMRARGLVDVIIPRGGAGLINAVVANSIVPVIETGVGNCHLFIDASADIDKAVAIAVNSKTQRVSVCNTLETLLVHEQIAAEFLPKLLAEYQVRGVTVHGSPEIAAPAAAAGVAFAAATDDDWAREYLSLDIAVRIVPDLATAIEHIQRWSTGHTEAIVTESLASAEQFTSAIDSAAVMVNASTRFTDGGEFGFGAEIGISTQKLHARGPMGLAELTSTKYVVTGNGQIRN